MNQGLLYGIIKRPLITEKANDLKDGLSKYSFEVALGANKLQVRHAVEKLFKVDVTDVRTVVVRGKWRRVGRSFGKRSNWKKAIVTLRPGQEIDLFGEA